MSANNGAAIEIRAATPPDIDAVLTLWELSETHPTITDDRAGVALLIADAPGALLIAVDGERVVGTVIAAWNGWRGSIYRIAVAPSHRRRGLARALLSSATQRLGGLGARRIDAFVIRDDVLARSFWGSLAPEWAPDPLEKLRYVRAI
ncbi:MAG: GNAT family N-acetyltransferase [Candidatus Dormibacteria bacterium]